LNANLLEIEQAHLDDGGPARRGVNERALPGSGLLAQARV
jgi:hypothetical protein